jgi:hypothetical protein
MGVEPLQVPSVAVSVSPCSAVPPIVGSAVLTGGVAVTVEVCALNAEAAPPALTAVTVTRMVDAGEVKSACCTT